MSDFHILGKKGEELAAEFLKKEGYTILEKNWKAGKLEIDIIARKEDEIIFVEVKTRSDNYLATPESAVNTKKQRSIISAANRYLKKNGIDMESRFDIITLVKEKDNFIIDHIKNAFYHTPYL
ncbi:MAG: YraN family protein [Bacteroidales bacterium]|jgi:putative endonuclease